MLHAAINGDIIEKIKSFAYYLSFPRPFSAPAALTKMLILLFLSYSLYKALADRLHPDRKEVAAALLGLHCDASSG